MRSRIGVRRPSSRCVSVPCANWPIDWCGAVRLHRRGLPAHAQVPCARKRSQVGSASSDRRDSRGRLSVQHERYRCVYFCVPVRSYTQFSLVVIYSCLPSPPLHLFTLIISLNPLTHTLPSFPAYMRADIARRSHGTHRKGMDGISGSRLVQTIARRNGIWTKDAFNSSRGVPPLHLLWLYVPPGTLHAMLEVHWVLAAV